MGRSTRERFTLAFSGECFVVVHAEVSGTGIQKQGSKMCRIGMNNEVMARAGSMVAYQGDLKFEAQGSGGIGRAIRQTLSGEGPLRLGRGLADIRSITRTDRHRIRPKIVPASSGRGLSALGDHRTG
jgi:uncharacterized protein (AIM24 family)